MNIHVTFKITYMLRLKEFTENLTLSWKKVHFEAKVFSRHFIFSNFPGGGTPYNGLYGEAPPERGTFFRLQVYKWVGISQVKVYKR